MSVHEIEPRRWADDPDGGPLGDVLRDARGDLPTDGRLDALASRLGLGSPATAAPPGDPLASEVPSIAPAPVPPPPAGQVVAGPWATGRAAFAGLAAAAVVGLGVYLGASQTPGEPAVADRLVPAPDSELLPAAPEPPTTAAGAVDENVAEQADEALPAVAPARSQRLRPRPPTPGDPEPQPAVAEAPPSDELPAGEQGVTAPAEPTAPVRSERELVTEMRQNARTAPFVALRAVAEHAEHYPTGAFALERRAYEIVAVAAQGRIDEARRLERAYRAAHRGPTIHDQAIADALGD